MFTESSKPDHGEERDRGGHRDGGEHPAIAAGVEHHDPAEVGVALDHHVEPDTDHDDQRRDLDQREQHVELHALAHTTQVDQRQQHHERERHEEHGARAARHRDADRVQSGEQVDRQQVRRRRGTRDARGDHAEGDQEGHEVDAERLVRVEGSAGGLRVVGHQLEVGERRERRDPEGDQERHPDDAAHLEGHLAGHRVDARTEDVADDEQQQQRRAHHPVELGLFFDVRVLRCGCRHPRLPRSEYPKVRVLGQWWPTSRLAASIAARQDSAAQDSARRIRRDGQPKKTSASAYCSGCTSFSSPVPSASGTRTMSVPRSATILP